MPLLSWKPEYSVSEPALDSHHKRLFEILNTAYENVMSSLEVECVLPAIEELTEYVRYHLVAEELHMRDKGFQGIDAHIAEHEQFKRHVEVLRANYRGNNLEATQELIVLLGQWLLHHVMTEDRKYSVCS